MLTGTLKEQFLSAIQRLLRPVVRQLIAYSVSYQAFSRLARHVYLEVAEQDFALPYKRQTDSRLALLTGIHRKDIAQWRRRASVLSTPEVEDTLATHVIGRWLASPPYVTADGSPQRLPYESDDPAVPSFARLVREVGTDLPVRSVLDELLRVGAVALLADGDVVLQQEANIPSDDAAGKLTLLGSDPAELFSTIMHNIEHPEAPRLQRKVVYDNIPPEALPAVRDAARRLGTDFIRRANTLLAAHDRDRNPDAPAGARVRVVLGAFYFDAEATPPTSVITRGGPPLPGRIRRSR